MLIKKEFPLHFFLGLISFLLSTAGAWVAGAIGFFGGNSKSAGIFLLLSILSMALCCVLIFSVLARVAIGRRINKVEIKSAIWALAAAVVTMLITEDVIPMS